MVGARTHVCMSCLCLCGGSQRLGCRCVCRLCVCARACMRACVCSLHARLRRVCMGVSERWLCARPFSSVHATVRVGTSGCHRRADDDLTFITPFNESLLTPPATRLPPSEPTPFGWACHLHGLVTHPVSRNKVDVPLKPHSSRALLICTWQ